MLCMHTYVGGGKGGAMGLQPYLVIWVSHKILTFAIEISSCEKISPTLFSHLPPPMHAHTVLYTFSKILPHNLHLASAVIVGNSQLAVHNCISKWVTMINKITINVDRRIIIHLQNYIAT